jgi:hypothetical protein
MPQGVRVRVSPRPPSAFRRPERSEGRLKADVTPCLLATVLHLLGLDREALTFRFCGRDPRLTDVRGNLLREILA